MPRQARDATSAAAPPTRYSGRIFTPSRVSAKASAEARGRPERSRGAHLAEASPRPAGLREREGHGVRQRHPQVQALAPHDAHGHHPAVRRHEGVGAEAEPEQQQHERGDQRLAEAGEQGQDAEGRDAAALAHGLEEPGLPARDADLADEEVVVQAHLQHEREPDEGGREREEGEAAPAFAVGEREGTFRWSSAA